MKKIASIITQNSSVTFRLIAGRFINPATGKLKKGTIRLNRRSNPFRGVCGFEPKLAERHCEVFSGERPKFSASK